MKKKILRSGRHIIYFIVIIKIIDDETHTALNKLVKIDLRSLSGNSYFCLKIPIFYRFLGPSDPPVHVI